MSDILYIVVPCYNEKDVLPETARQLKNKMEELIECCTIHKDSRIVFVDDGSKDETWETIRCLCIENRIYSGIKLSRNCGHQNALLAGLMTARAKADAVISMDADLQDDIDAVDEMLEKYYSGCDIVYGVRSDRKSDSAFKRVTAECFYKVMRFLGAETVFNHADYRLMSKRALDGLDSFKEVNLYLRGIVPMLGYKAGQVYYKRKERFAGESKYPLKKMLAFAAEGITSLSSKPIRYIALTGLIMFMVSLVMICYFLVNRLAGYTVSGWASVICSLWAIGGLIMLSLGIIGEYIGKTYMESKGRPKYFIETVLDNEDE